ncbi:MULTISPECIES: DUF2911 domain-containing protein [Acidobacterium]|uniref:DUF2911 domain-containing protein n=1 Tax=Acidobacterium capsulatum (strain ATCC 51196 / DSM 11244 / BCRC 80197 / JCM 7670 / NBRC 15755 / NCIMB 13165 / 161) TaxID=240015 RepID=C1F8P6_ACIC5|nr:MULTISPECIES: DUF2911 domain-containing protein [Acidobacterium]ACO31812.1 hypothetical protein ACP_0175 [Acidobacterium capsulatum ATCC 51196]
MKRLLLSFGLAALVTASTFSASAQMKKKAPLSPPEQVSAMANGQTISIKYSSPRVRGREGHIFGPGGLISHDVHYPVWRAGANAATTLTTTADLTIGHLEVPKGTYTLFVNIKDPNHWVLIVNKETGEWGLAYKAADDLGSVPMHMHKPKHMIEDLVWKIKINDQGKGKLVLAWENHKASVPFRMH